MVSLLFSAVSLMVLLSLDSEKTRPKRTRYVSAWFVRKASREVNHGTRNGEKTLFTLSPVTGTFLANQKKR